MIKPIIILASFLSTGCFADMVPTNALQMQYQQNFKQTKQNPSEFYLNPVFQIPEATYKYLDSVFSSFYQRLSFNTSIANSTFKKNAYSQLVAIPIIPTNEDGFQLEFFGNFSNPSSQYLSNLSADHLLYNYRNNSEVFDIYNSDLALGAGISFNTGSDSKIKIVFSNNEIPGYGTSKALVGFESRF
ncbi:MAG: hypothetical protein ACJAZP_000460 [Psychromonas sp.]|uniref:hypothetical protein n=1 Tax=Psychromonas sp. TaxID=1884585 RepID=UPI0039E22800